MSPALKYWDGSAWQTLVGAPGVPGYTPSARAHSGAYTITADQNGRFLNPPLTVDWNDFGGTPFAGSNAFNAPAAGKYLVGIRLSEMAPGTAALAGCKNMATVAGRHTQAITTGADGSKGGLEAWDMWNLAAGDTIIPWGYSSGGGSTNIITFDVIRLDAPALNVITNIPLVTSLPTAPVDGQEIYYLADATNGIVWHLRYRAASASAYKWEFIGGGPLSSTVDTAESTTSGTYAALATAGPSVTVPLAGEYVIERDGACGNNTAGAFHYWSYDIGATAAVDGDSTMFQWISGLNVWANVTRTQKKTLAANTALVSKYKLSAGTGSWGNRNMKVTPVRVG